MDTVRAVEVIVRVMSPHIGPTMARSATEAHCQKLGVEGKEMTVEQLELLLGKLASGLNIFLGRERSATLIGEVRRALAEGGLAS